jgi:hypothetical protein
MSEDATPNEQRAAAGFEAIRAYAEASEPRYIQDRVARLLCDLRHYADRISGMRFDEVLDHARTNHRSGSAQRLGLGQEAAVRRATEVQDRQAFGSQPDGWWPPGMLADLWGYADAHRIDLEEAAARLSAALITDLQHYADDHGVDFAKALAASERVYTEQRLQGEGPFQAGYDTRRGLFLVPSPGAPPFQPVATRQGVVISVSDAEWLFVRTAARLHELERRGKIGLARPADLSDERALGEALAGACGLTAPEVLRELEPLVRERADAVEHAVEDAAEMGREHGLAGVEPYCRLDEDGRDGQLMKAFGETEPTTDANAMHRLALIRAYATAYRDARRQAGGTPVQLAEHGFPHEAGCSPTRPDPLDSSDPVRAVARTESRHPRKAP